MAKELQVRKGALLLWRLGTINFGEQSRWSRAPQKKGLWAFPWPYYDMFLTYHQYRDRLPKLLRTASNSRYPLALEWYEYPDGATPEEVTFDEAGYILEEDISVREEFWDKQREWIETVGPRVLPLRKFWYEGELYSHIQKTGKIGNPGTMGQGKTDWYSMHSSELAMAIKRARGDRYISRPKNPGEGISDYPSGVDHLEVFIAPGRGRITSTPK